MLPDLRNSIFLAKRMVVALLLMVVLFSGTSAFGGDYTLAYGFDDPEYSEAGKLDCAYDKYCDLVLKNGNISLTLDFSDPRHRIVVVMIHRTNWGPGCCYFDGGATRMSADPRSRSALGVSFGRARRGLEYVESNMHFGVLSLIFSQQN
jgi:hypothetical protein